MGIEPTGPTFDVRPNGFEGRAEHQLKEHFPRSTSFASVHTMRITTETEDHHENVKAPIQVEQPIFSAPARSI